MIRLELVRLVLSRIVKRFLSIYIFIYGRRMKGICSSSKQTMLGGVNVLINGRQARSTQGEKCPL